MLSEQNKTQIDVIKTFAIFSIILYNINPNFLPGGFLGIDVLFVLSGYLIFISNLRMLGNDTFLKFFKRVLNLLLPKTIICVVISAILSILFLPPTLWQSIKDAIWVLSGLQNINLYTDLDYLKIIGFENSIFFQFWSISVIIQFCFVFSLLWYLMPRFSLNKFYKYISFIALTSFFFTLFLFNNYEQYKNALYLLPIFRFWEIGLGIITCYLSDEIFKNKIKFKFFNSKIIPADFIKSSLEVILLITLIFIICLPINQIISIILACSITSLIILNSKFNKKSLLKKTIDPKIFSFIGKRIYLIYIYHWMFIVIFNSIFGSGNYYFYISVISSTLITALIPWNNLFNNFRKDDLIINNIFEKKSINFIFFTVLNTGIFAYILTYFVGPKIKTFDNYNSHFFSSIGLGKKEISKAHKDLPDWESVIRNCHFRFNSISPKELAEKCLNNESHGSQNDLIIYLLGDSHAGTLLPMVHETKEMKTEKNIFVKNVHVNSFVEIIKNKIPFDFEHIKETINKNDIVLIHFNSGKFRNNKLTEKQKQNFINYLRNFANDISLKGGYVIFIKDNASLKSNLRIDKCIFQDSLGVENSCKIKKSEVYLRRKNSEIIIDEIKKDLPSDNVLTYDMLENMCSNSYCDYKNKNGELVMQDSNHITFNESLRQAKEFKKFMKKFIK